ncbi:MAG: molybdopterin oxidoreductase family protein [Pyrobaculum sp.]
MGTTRRDFLKAAAALGAIGASGGVLLAQRSAQSVQLSGENEKWISAVCPFCASGCAIQYCVRDGRIVAVRGDPEGWNGGRTCVKGASTVDNFLPHSPGVRTRVLKPAIRLDKTKRGTFEGFREVTWDEALQFIVDRFKEYAKSYAGDKKAFGMYGSGQSSNEFHLLQSLVFVIGLDAHSDSNGRLCQATKVMSMVVALGIDGPPMSFDDVYETDNLFIIGFSVADTLPGWFGKIVDAKTRRGADLKIVVIDPVKVSATRILDYETGDRYVPIMPGTDIALLNSMAYVIIYELEGVKEKYNGDVDKWIEDIKNGKTKPRYIDIEFIEKYTNFYRGDYKVLSRLTREGPVVFNEIFVGSGLDGFREYAKFISKFIPEEVSKLTKVEPELIREIARIFVRGRNTMSIFLQGFGQYSNGVAKALTLFTLHAITGRIGRAGAGVHPTVGQPNGLGQRVGGIVVGRLPGNRNHPVRAHRLELARVLSRGDPEIEKLVLNSIEKTTPDGKIVSKLGYTTVDMIKAVQRGEMKGIWINCTNPMVSFPNLNLLVDALKKADLVVVQDAFWSETTAFADVVLPAALLSGESWGTFFNTERRVQLHQKAVDPPGDALSDVVILLAFAYKYIKTLEREGRGDEVKLLKFLLEPVYSGFEHLFENVQQNVDKLRGEVEFELNKRLFEYLARISKGVPSNDLSGLTYERLLNERDHKGRKGFQIPVPSPESKGTERLYDENYEKLYGRRFPTPDGRMRCFLWEYVPPAEWPDENYPFILTTRRLYEHWHTRSRTGKCALPHRLAPEPWVSINPEDAARLGIKDGDLVEIESKRGKIVLKARVDVKTPPRPGVLWTPWAFGYLGDMFRGVRGDPPGLWTANVVTNETYDPLSRQPEFKFSAVRIRKVGGL